MDVWKSVFYLLFSHRCVHLHSASTRKLYEKKLQKLLDQTPAETPTEPEATTEVTALTKADTNQNGNTNSDQYSDKEDGELLAHINDHYLNFYWTYRNL